MRKPRLGQFRPPGLDPDQLLLAQAGEKLDEKERAAAGASGHLQQRGAGFGLQHVGRDLGHPGLTQRTQNDLLSALALQPVHGAPDPG